MLIDMHNIIDMRTPIRTQGHLLSLLPNWLELPSPLWWLWALSSLEIPVTFAPSLPVVSRPLHWLRDHLHISSQVAIRFCKPPWSYLVRWYSVVDLALSLGAIPVLSQISSPSLIHCMIHANFSGIPFCLRRHHASSFWMFNLPS